MDARTAAERNHTNCDLSVQWIFSEPVAQQMGEDQLARLLRQRNLYLKSGAGIAYEDGESEAVIYGGISTDWENRRFYLSYSNEFLSAGDIYTKNAHTARVGIAPYKGDSGDLHTWLMLQADYDPQRDNEISVTPLVRLFKGTTLGELGANLDGGVYFHLMKTF